MSRPSRRLVALLVVAGATAAASAIAIADPGSVTGALPSGTLDFVRLEIHEDGGSDLTVPSTPAAGSAYFDLAHCICSLDGLGSEQSFAYELTLDNYTSDTGAAIPLEIWSGVSCDQDTLRGSDCTQLATISDYRTLAVGSDNTEIPIYQFMNAGSNADSGMCQQVTQTDTYWILAKTQGTGLYDYFATEPISTDTLPPPLPTDFAAEPGEGAIELTWSAPTENQNDVYFYQALCANQDGTPALSSPADDPRYVTPYTLCGTSDGAVTLTPSDISVTTSGTDGGVDAATPGSATLPTNMANLDPSYICGEATATATSMRIEGLTNGSAYTVALVSVDAFANVTGTYFTQTITPQPVTDFWEDLHDRNSKVEGGFCLLAETYGDDSGLTNTLRSFRDDTLGGSRVGRWLTDVYYATLAPIGRYVHGSIALRIISGVLLAPLVMLALGWHFLTLPGLLALMVFAWMWRRRRKILRARGLLVEAPRTSRLRTAAISLLALVGISSRAHAGGNSAYWDDEDAIAQANEDTSDASSEDAIKWHVGLRVGPYTPQIDAQLGGASPGPYKQMFGGYALLPMVDVDRVIWRGSGQLAVGGSLGFLTKSAHPFVEGSLPSDPDRPRSAGDSNSFNLIPFALTATYRATQLDDLYGIPVIPYARVGLSYYAWWVKAPDGGFADVYENNGTMCPDTDTTGCSKNRALGASAGIQGSIGISIRAERIDSSAAESMRESGLQHAGVFAEYDFAWVNGFGHDTKLSVGDNTFFGGVDFEF